jgi:hypothetical protein
LLRGSYIYDFDIVSVGGLGREEKAGKTRVAYIGAERVLGGRGPGRAFESLHAEVAGALSLAARAFKWRPENIGVGFFTRGRRLAFAWRPGSAADSVRILCLSGKLAREGTAACLRFAVLHELAHHWREEKRLKEGKARVKVTSGMAHDAFFCDNLRRAADGLWPVGRKCARAVPAYDARLSPARPPPAAPGHLRVRVLRRGWAASWVPRKGRLPPSRVALWAPMPVSGLADLRRLASMIPSEEAGLVRVEYVGAKRANFPRPATLPEFLASATALERASRARSEARKGR